LSGVCWITRKATAFPSRDELAQIKKARAGRKHAAEGVGSSARGLAPSSLTGLIIFALPAARVRLRTGSNLFGATVKLNRGMPGLVPAFRHQIIAEGPVASAGNQPF
jgi:hypothetical protein